MDVLNRVPVREQEPAVRAKNFEEVCYGYNEEEAMAEAARCIGCKNAQCVKGCPVSIDIPGFIAHVKKGEFAEAFQVISKSSALPAVCGRVCPQETQCEGKCIRGIKGDPVSIGKLERFVADWAKENGIKPVPAAQKNGHKVAVIGSGPSGLTCAGDLAKAGYDVTVFEALHELGGVLVYGIPEFRLPKQAVVQPEVMAIQKKKDSSIVVGLNLVKKQEADAFVSSGSTGEVLVGGQVIVGRIKGIRRPPLAPLIPTAKGVSLLIDCGANVDARPDHLVQFAQMGSIYMENVVGIKKPRVAIVNNGAEEEKGNALVKATFPLLKACKDINFIGSIEARDIPSGYADVVVCEAFVGNVILKLYEGVGATLISMIKKGMMTNIRSKMGALMVKPALKETLKSFDASEYGGAPLLGLKGLVVKSHGSARSVEIRHAIFQCEQFKEEKINEKIAERILEDQE